MVNTITLLTGAALLTATFADDSSSQAGNTENRLLKQEEPKQAQSMNDFLAALGINQEEMKKWEEESKKAEEARLANMTEEERAQEEEQKAAMEKQMQEWSKKMEEEQKRIAAFTPEEKAQYEEEQKAKMGELKAKMNNALEGLKGMFPNAANALQGLSAIQENGCMKKGMSQLENGKEISEETAKCMEQNMGDLLKNLQAGFEKDTEGKTNEEIMKELEEKLASVLGGEKLNLEIMV